MALGGGSVDIDRWTASRASALHKAYRQIHPDVSDEQFAQRILGIAPRTLYNWQKAPATELRPSTQRLLNRFYRSLDPAVKQRFWRALEERGDPLALRSADKGASEGAGLGTQATIYQPSLEQALAILEQQSTKPPRKESIDPRLFVDAAIDWLVNPVESIDISAARNVSASVVEEIRKTTSALDRIERHVGGPHCRSVAVEYLRKRVLPILHENQKATVRRGLFSAAAALCELIGWMSYDAEEHRTAATYFVQGLRLAREADDTAYGAFLLTSMSHQALHLKNPRQALRLAQLARDRSEHVNNPSVLTEACLLEARAYAELGDRKGGTSALLRADKSFGLAMPEDSPEWAKAWDGVLFASHAGTCWVNLGDAEEARRAMTVVWNASQDQPRRRVYSAVQLARAALLSGNLDEAYELGNSALDTIGTTSSQRSRTQIRNLLGHLHPFSTEPLIRELNERARSVLAEQERPDLGSE